MSRIVLKTIFKLKRAKAATWASQNPILEEGEPGFVIDQNKLKIGTGTTHWNDLPYIAGGSEIEIVGDGKSIVVTTSDNQKVLSLLGLDTAAVGTIPTKGSDGKLAWTNVSTPVPITEAEIRDICK